MVLMYTVFVRSKLLLFESKITSEGDKNTFIAVVNVRSLDHPRPISEAGRANTSADCVVSF